MWRLAIRYGKPGMFYNLIFLYVPYVCVEWTSEIKNETFTVYKVEFFDCGPEIILSLAIKKDFSWIVLYRRQCVNQEFCSLLRIMPSKMDSGMF